MHIQQILAKSNPAISFEFFPPKSDKPAAALDGVIEKLNEASPAYVSVTYGAGGGTQQSTFEVVDHIQSKFSIPVVAHLTSVCHSEADLHGILSRYAASGLENIMALGGDPPLALNHDRSKDAFRYASGLVGFIKRLNESGIHPNGKGFGIGVAGYPEGHPATPNRLKEIEYLKAKVDAGADYVCTQLFFENGDFHDFRERCELAGIRVPVFAGILPITTYKGVLRMAELSGGSRYPAKLWRRILEARDNDAEIRRIGVEWAAAQTADLLANGVRGIHFYTLNQSGPTLEVLKAVQ